MNGKVDSLVSTDWLARHLDDPAIRVVDGSFHLPTSGRDPSAEFAGEHIPGAAFFDIDAIRDASTDLPHMLPMPGDFAVAMERLGIGSEHHVIVYDNAKGAAAPRVWWTFRAFGHARVSVLDGGLAKWRAEGRPLTDAAPTAKPGGHFMPDFNAEWVADRDAVMAVVERGGAQIVDNRGEGRFAGREPEPRPAKRQGHVPGSVNIPFTDFFEPARHHVWRPTQELAARFATAGIDLEQPIISLCGSGVTACTTAFAAHLVGHDTVAVYDGSWAEWGNRDDTPVER